MAKDMSVYSYECYILQLNNKRKLKTVAKKDTELEEALENFCCGCYSNILSSEFGKRIIKQNPGNLESFDAILQHNVDAYLSDATGQDSEKDREFDVLLLAVASLQLFVQNNWVGPAPFSPGPADILPDIYISEEKQKELRDFMEEELSVTGEPVYTLTAHLEYLYIAWFLLYQCRSRLKNLQTAEWWLLRCLGIQQQVLDSRSSALSDSIMELIPNIQNKEPLMTDDRNRDLCTQFHLEAGHLSHMFYQYKAAKEHFNTARKTAGIGVELTGLMGKRTQFQQKDTAQLVLKVTREGPPPEEDEISLPSQLPKNLSLDDDTVLDAINFREGEEIPYINMTAVEQAVVLGIMEEYRRSQAHAEQLTEEECLAYLTCVLKDVKNWSVSVAALLLRSRLEKKSRRRIERSMMQLEELVNQTRRDSPPVCERMDLFYSVSLVPIWTVQMQLAELLVSLGALGSALEIYERLEVWEQAVSCYQRLGKLEKAESVLREKLAVKETPNLWCYLGDITNNIECYEKGWELSNHRSARAQRCMAYMYFTRQEYSKCLECFEKSLSINALQIPVWFTYGCAAMAADNNKLAVKAFRRCVGLDYDNFEAWNNLATSYVKLKEKKKAFMTLTDAIKCNYENWRIWENYLVVGTDCGEFATVIQAYHRLMDLRDKWEDPEVLKCLVLAVTQNLPDAKQQPSEHLKPKLKELFGRITAKVTNNAEIWRLYAQLSEGDSEKVLQFLQKSHRSVMQQASWEKDEEKCNEVGNQSVQLADMYITCSETTEDSTKAIQMLSSAKLMLRGVVTKIKKQHTDPISQKLAEAVSGSCTSLEEKLTEVVDKITHLKGS